MWAGWPAARSVTWREQGVLRTCLMGQNHSRVRDHIPTVNNGDLALVRFHDTQAGAGRPWCYLLGNYRD